MISERLARRTSMERAQETGWMVWKGCLEHGYWSIACRKADLEGCGFMDREPQWNWSKLLARSGALLDGYAT